MHLALHMPTLMQAVFVGVTLTLLALTEHQAAGKLVYCGLASLLIFQWHLQRSHLRWSQVVEGSFSPLAGAVLGPLSDPSAPAGAPGPAPLETPSSAPSLSVPKCRPFTCPGMSLKICCTAASTRFDCCLAADETPAILNKMGSPQHVLTFCC